MPDAYFTKLNNINYIDWKYQIEAYLTTKDLWGIADSLEGRPAGSTNTRAVKAWMRKQKLARTEIILRVEPDQPPHTHFDNPKDIWDNLEKVHHACRFATHLLLRRQFLSMKQDELKSMHSWIATVRHLAQQLTKAGTEVMDDDITIALTLGLPPSYENFVVMLDATPDDQLTLDHIITCFFNEESHHQMASGTADEIEAQDTALFARRNSKANITRHRCGR
jgi:gag-polypeptide of LTR copia-type